MGFISGSGGASSKRSTGLFVRARRESNFLQQLPAVVQDKESFFFSKRSMDGNAREQVLTCIAKCLNVVLNLHGIILAPCVRTDNAAYEVGMIGLSEGEETLPHVRSLASCSQIR